MIYRHYNDQSIDALLYCLGADLVNNKSSLIDGLSVMDWECIIRHSDRFKVTPLLYHRLKNIVPDADIPEDILKALQEKYLFNAGRNIRLYHQLSNVLKMMVGEGIPVILLKGTHLAEIVYGNIALRPMIDMDLLVKKEDLARIEVVFTKLDYTIFGNKSWYEKNHFHYIFTPPGKGVTVEIHWHILPQHSPFSIDIDSIWERAKTTEIGGISTLVLSAEDLLLHLCLHLAYKNLFVDGFQGLCDVFNTIKHYQKEIVWEQIHSRTSQWKMKNLTYLTFKLAEKLLGADLPAEMLDKLKPDDFEQDLASWAMEKIMGNTYFFGPNNPNLARLLGSDRLWDKLLLLKRKLFPFRENLAYSYDVRPDTHLIYFYYFLNFGALFSRNIIAIWRVLRGDGNLYNDARNEKILIDWLESA